MAVMKHCLHSENHYVKKLTLLFWEVVERKSPQGKLLPEMILVCNAMKINLDHPNEYIRGNTLRLLTKLCEPDILESLVPSIVSNLTHRHSYVRKNAFFTLMAIHKTCPDLVPDTPQLVKDALAAEYSPIAKRNALLCLLHTAPAQALEYVVSILPALHMQGDALILVALETIKRAVGLGIASRADFLAPVYALLTQQGVSAAALFEAGNTLLFLSKAPAAAAAALQAYTDLLARESDNNVKLIVLDHVAAVAANPRVTPVVQAALLDILKATQTPDTAIRTKVLALAGSLCTGAQAADVVAYLRRELQALGAAEQPEERPAASANVDVHAPAASLSLDERYRRLLIAALFRAAADHPSVVAQVAPTLAQHLHGTQPAAAVEVASFLRLILHGHPALRGPLCAGLADGLMVCSVPEVMRASCWLVGEFCGRASEQPPAEPAATNAATTTAAAAAADDEPADTDFTAPSDPAAAAAAVSQLRAATQAVLAAVGDVTLAPARPEADTPRAATASTSTTVLADGTYSTQTVYSAPAAARTLPLLDALAAGDGFTASALVVALTKLVLRWGACAAALRADASAIRDYNLARAQTMRLAVALLELRPAPPNPADVAAGRALPAEGLLLDSAERVALCLKLLLDPDAAWLPGGRHVLGAGAQGIRAMALAKQAREADADADAVAAGAPAAAAVASQAAAKAPAKKAVRVSSLVLFRQLGGADEDEEESALSRSSDADVLLAARGPDAPGAGAAASSGDGWSAPKALTGVSDAVFVEARLRIRRTELTVELSVSNLSGRALQNACVELHTSSDLVVAARPTPFSLAAGGKHTTTVPLRVRSTESASIMGAVVLGSANGADQTVVSLTPLQVDIVRYIAPASCPDVLFRALWAEFEWENKVPVATGLTDLVQYLRLVRDATNTRCLTPIEELQQCTVAGCDFLAANLYAVSLFGEEALLNVSVEKTNSADGTPVISGYIRIRAKTQGIALGLGDQITTKQRLSASSAVVNPVNIVVENV
jgi:coatomer subunit beta